MIWKLYKDFEGNHFKEIFVRIERKDFWRESSSGERSESTLESCHSYHRIILNADAAERRCCAELWVFQPSSSSRNLLQLGNRSCHRVGWVGRTGNWLSKRQFNHCLQYCWLSFSLIATQSNICFPKKQSTQRSVRWHKQEGYEKQWGLRTNTFLRNAILNGQLINSKSITKRLKEFATKLLINWCLTQRYWDVCRL